jgi:hypothetical protein
MMIQLLLYVNYKDPFLTIHHLLEFFGECFQRPSSSFSTQPSTFSTFSVPDLLRTFGVSSDVTKDIRNLVATFGLEANNINFQPLEWNLIGMVIIKM